MAVADLIARLEAARSVQIEAAGASFSVRLPTDHAWRALVQRHADAHGRLLEAEAFRALLDEALVGWSGVTERLVDPAAGETPLAFDAQARRALLDHRQDVADEIAVAVALKLRERREAREAAAKN